MALTRIPDYCEALVGYRVWRVAEGGLLTGVHVVSPWEPKQAHRASCQRKRGDGFWNVSASHTSSNVSPHMVKGVYLPSPAFHCSCGIWAKRQEADVFAAADAMEATAQAGYAWGTVSLWGRVIEHTEGWRAEFGYPKALQATSYAQEIAALYGIACEAVTVKKPAKSDDDGFCLSTQMWKYWATTPVMLSSQPLGVVTSVSSLIEARPEDVLTEQERLKKDRREQQAMWRTFLSTDRRIKQPRAKVFQPPVIAGGW